MIGAMGKSAMSLIMIGILVVVKTSAFPAPDSVVPESEEMTKFKKELEAFKPEPRQNGNGHLPTTLEEAPAVSTGDADGLITPDDVPTTIDGTTEIATTAAQAVSEAAPICTNVDMLMTSCSDSEEKSTALWEPRSTLGALIGDLHYFSPLPFPRLT